MLSRVAATVARIDRRKLLARLARGAVANVKFADLQDLVEGLGFELRRTSGSHDIYTHPAIPSPRQPPERTRPAKPYQVRQVLRLVERYGLQLKDDQ